MALFLGPAEYHLPNRNEFRSEPGPAAAMDLAAWWHAGTPQV
jgi:hypothetical protein